MKPSNIYRAWVSTLLGLLLWTGLGLAYAYHLDIPEIIQIGIFLLGFAALPSSWFDDKVIELVKSRFKK